jgi:hypothetical protein
LRCGATSTEVQQADCAGSSSSSTRTTPS